MNYEQIKPQQDVDYDEEDIDEGDEQQEEEQDEPDMYQQNSKLVKEDQEQAYSGGESEQQKHNANAGLQKSLLYKQRGSM